MEITHRKDALSRYKKMQTYVVPDMHVFDDRCTDIVYLLSIAFTSGVAQSQIIDCVIDAIRTAYTQGWKDSTEHQERADCLEHLFNQEENEKRR